MSKLNPNYEKMVLDACTNPNQRTMMFTVFGELQTLLKRVEELEKNKGPVKTTKKTPVKGSQ